MMISRSELEANLVVAGVKETKGENPKDVFLSLFPIVFGINPKIAQPVTCETRKCSTASDGELL